MIHTSDGTDRCHKCTNVIPKGVCAFDNGDVLTCVPCAMDTAAPKLLTNNAPTNLVTMTIQGKRITVVDGGEVERLQINGPWDAKIKTAMIENFGRLVGAAGCTLRVFDMEVTE